MLSVTGGLPFNLKQGNRGKTQPGFNNAIQSYGAVFFTPWWLCVRLLLGFDLCSEFSGWIGE